MIRKLRIRLILTTMLAVLLVLIVLMGGINLFNYRQVISESDDILSLLHENGGAFMLPPDGMEPVDPIPPSEREGRNGFIRFDEGRIHSKELAYETRYFSVLLSSDGKIIHTDTKFISAISEKTANEYAQRVFKKGSSSGFIGDYRYLVGNEGPDGNRLIIFRDCGASLANFRNFRNISIVVSLICLLVVGTLVFFASGRVIRPVAESYEKQKRFITDAGHEIKTPLAIITADADVLEMENDGGSENEWLSDIKLQVSRLSALTQDLISLSKMEETDTTLNMTDLDLSSLTRTQANSFTAAMS